MRKIIYFIGFILFSCQTGEATEAPETEKIDFRKLRSDLDSQLWWSSRWVSNARDKSELTRQIAIVEDRYTHMEQKCAGNDRKIEELHRQSEIMLKALNCVEFATDHDLRWLGDDAPGYKKRIGECLDIYRREEFGRGSPFQSPVTK